jgi:hypothetical protein
MRAVRRWVPLVLLFLIAGLVALVLTSRPDLEDARKEVDRRWDAVTAPLDERYTLLAAANGAVGARPGPPGEISADVSQALENWVDARRDGDRDRAISAANDLEGLGRRFVLVVGASRSLTADPAVMEAVNAFASSPSPAELAAFRDAVRAYENERDGPARTIVAGMFGYDAVPAVVVTEAPA